MKAKQNFPGAGRSSVPADGREGLAPRRAATLLLLRVVDDQRSLEELTTGRGSLGEYARLPVRDRALSRAIALTALRNKQVIDHALDGLWKRPPPAKARWLVHTLTIAAAQILFMHLPDSAAVNLAVAAIGEDRRTSRFSGFANAVLRRLVREKEAILAALPAVLPFSPEIARLLNRDYGRETAGKMALALRREPVIDLVFNPERTASAEAIDAALLPLGVRRLKTSAEISELPGYREGEWWVQDIAASLPARLLGDIRGKAVADLCAAPGGKTMQLAAAGADVTAVDIAEARLAVVRDNLERTGLCARLVAADILTWQPAAKFDAVLLDAPCTATGTARRHPDIFWNKSAEDAERLSRLQRRMIKRAADFVRPGGLLVYANCSLLKQEGEALVANLGLDALSLSPIGPEELPGLTNCINSQGTLRCLPHYLALEPPELGGMDGFFAARFVVR